MGKSNQQTIAKTAIRVALYARYSGKNQNKESANDQIKRMRRILGSGVSISLVKFSLDQNSPEILEDWVIKDEAKSGKIAGRAGYEQIKSGVRQKAFDLLLVDDLSRITRELGDQIDFYKLLKFHGVELYSFCDNLSSESANAKMAFTVKGMINDMGNEVHAARTKRGLENRAVDGFSAGDVCYGYISTPTSTRRTCGFEVPCDFKLSINPIEAEAINLAFDLKISGLGYSEIARELTKRGYPSPSRGTKITGKAMNWQPPLIRKLLTREKYIGVWAWGRTSKAIDPDTQKVITRNRPKNEWVEHNNGQLREDLKIVTLEQWTKVQKIIGASTARFHAAKQANKNAAVETMSAARAAGTRSKTLLAGVLQCGKCGGPMLQVVGTKGGFYGCTLYHRRNRTECDNSRLLRRQKVEALVSKEVGLILSSDLFVSQVVTTINKSINKNLNTAPEQMKLYKRQIAQLEQEIQNLISFVASTGGTAATKDQLISKEAQKFELEQQIKALTAFKSEQVLVTPFLVKERFQNLLGHLEKDPVLANAALRKLFPEGISCTPEIKTLKKNHNQNNSLWQVNGTLILGGESGFSPLKIGGGAGN